MPTDDQIRAAIDQAYPSANQTLKDNYFRNFKNQTGGWRNIERAIEPFLGAEEVATTVPPPTPTEPTPTEPTPTVPTPTPTTPGAEPFVPAPGPDESQQIFNRIINGELNPGEDEWTAMYVNGEATPAMQAAYNNWEAYLQTPEGQNFDWNTRNLAHQAYEDFRAGILTVNQLSSNLQTLGVAPPSFLQPDATDIVTGNPELDTFLNEQFLPLLEEMFSDNPAALLESDFFSGIEEMVEETYGTQFAEMLRLATETYERSRIGIEAQREKGLEDLEERLERGLEDIEVGEARTAEDVRLGKERIGRNLIEAQEESRAALANRGLTFGGVRRKEETRLTDIAGEQRGDLVLGADLRAVPLYRAAGLRPPSGGGDAAGDG